VDLPPSRIISAAVARAVREADVIRKMQTAARKPRRRATTRKQPSRAKPENARIRVGGILLRKGFVPEGWKGKKKDELQRTTA
jgi:hypothetical protein